MVTAEELIQMTDEIGDYKAPGPDGIPNNAYGCLIHIFYLYLLENFILIYFIKIYLFNSFQFF